MSTKTPRDKIHGLIKQNYNENTARCVVALVMPVIDALLEEARKEERAKNEKIQNAYGVYVADTMDGVEPEEAYKHMTKTIDSISSL